MLSELDLHKQLITFLFLHCALVIVAQDLSYTQYTMKDGLPQMQIDGLCKDHKGNLWIATRGGISRFDGVNFENFEDIDCLPSYAKAIDVDDSGYVWIYGQHSLIKFDGTNCTEYPFPDWAKYKYAKILTCLEDGSVLGNTYGKMPWVFHEDKFIKLSNYLELDSLLDIRYKF